MIAAGESFCQFLQVTGRSNLSFVFPLTHLNVVVTVFSNHPSEWCKDVLVTVSSNRSSERCKDDQRTTDRFTSELAAVIHEWSNQWWDLLHRLSWQRAGLFYYKISYFCRSFCKHLGSLGSYYIVAVCLRSWYLVDVWVSVNPVLGHV